jgi:hypothetical protein
VQARRAIALAAEQQTQQHSVDQQGQQQHQGQTPALHALPTFQPPDIVGPLRKLRQLDVGRLRRR